MTGLKYSAIRLMFEALWASQLPHLLRLLSGSKGVIFTLHRVLPSTPAEFAPNQLLQVRPDFLDYVIERVGHLGLETVSLDEAVRRIKTPSRTRKFVVFTFDDGYRDNRDHALPILRRHGCPFTVYLPTALVDGTGEVWWQALEDIIARAGSVTLQTDGNSLTLPTSTLAEKHAAFGRIYRQMRVMPEPERVDLIRSLATSSGLDLARHCRALIMDWREVAVLARDPLCTIGAHTVHHYELKKLSEADARCEIAQSVSIIEARLGHRPVHFSYPIGGPASAGEREYRLARELGLRSAVTTRPGGVTHAHKNQLHALPRISLNGLFQNRRYVDVLATGPIFSLLSRVTG